MCSPVDGRHNHEGFKVEDAGRRSSEIQGEHKPKAPSRVPKTHARWACVAENAKVHVVLTPANRCHDVYAVRDFDMIGKPNELPA